MVRSEVPATQVHSPCGDLRSFLGELEAAGELRYIDAVVDPVHELGGLTHIVCEQGGPALLFRNVRGFQTPLLTNVVATNKRYAMAFGTTEEGLQQAFFRGLERPIAPVVVREGPCKEEIQKGSEVNLMEFPAPVWHEGDGGAYMGTFHGCVTCDPSGRDINMGMYRMMIKGRNELSLGMGTRQHGSDHLRMYQAAGKSMPMAVVIGMHPLLSIASGHPVPDVGQSHEMAIVGGWRGRPVELVPCETIDVKVPADAEIVLEGEVVRDKTTTEGPHGESHGYFGQNDQALIFRVGCVTHRGKPIMQGTYTWLDQDGLMWLTRTLIFKWYLSKMELPPIVNLVLPRHASGRFFCVVSARVRGEGDVRKIADAVWAQRYDGIKWVIVVDEDADVHNWGDIVWRLSTMVMPHRDVWVSRQNYWAAHEPLARGGTVSTVCINATRVGKGVDFPDTVRISPELHKKINDRWSEYGL